MAINPVQKGTISDPVLWGDQVDIINENFEQAVTSVNGVVPDVNGNIPGLVPEIRKVNNKPLSADVVLAKSDVGLSSVDNTSDINKPVSTAQSIINKQKVDNSPTLIYNKNTWANLSEFTSTGFIVAPSVVNGNIRLSDGGSGAGNFAQYLVLNSIISTDEQITIDVYYRHTTALTSTTYGISVGLISVNPWYGMAAAAQFANNTGTGAIRVWDSTISAGTQKATGTAPQSTTTAICRTRFDYNGATIKAVGTDYTNGNETSISYASNLSVTKNFKIPNTAKPIIYLNGGTIDILQIVVTSKAVKNVLVSFYGDSKTVGYSTQGFRFSDVVARNYNQPVAVFAGDGDRTVEMVQSIDGSQARAKAKYTVLCIGRNDLATPVATATWQANYLSIVNSIKATGSTLIHLLPIPETGQDQSTLKAYILATFPNDLMVDCSVGWDNTYMLSSDTIHPTADGAKFVANKIIASGFIIP